jgi:intraflagellar transport protein 88
MYNEALTAYSAIVKNKQFSNAGRLRVNMGNIYFIQKKYPAAIKMYRMAMDQVRFTQTDLKCRVNFRDLYC